VGGPEGLSFSTCIGLIEDDLNEISNAEMTIFVTIRGETVETRNRLISDKSADVI
jgi:hypothetical protein